MANVVEEIKSRLDIVDVISEYVQLKRAGTSLKALCPFHQEKNPSFFVSPERQIWHCFSCNRGGDVFAFIKEIEGVEFPQALRILAKKAGVEIKAYDRRMVSQNTKILDISRLSAKFYHKVLLESSLAREARKYLKERGLDKKTITEFQLGFAPPGWDTLLKFLLKRGYKEADIEAAGLVIKRTEYPSTQVPKYTYYDRFRNRIIFPISDVHGQVVGFTSRILPGAEDKTAKYINTPETPIYNKSRVLYALDKAKLEARSRDSLILVEGQMDVLALHQKGWKNTVCTSGTALTRDQVAFIPRYTKNVILAFDVDAPGEAAAQRGIDLLLETGLDAKVVRLPEGKDPDECIRKNPKIWEQALKKALPIMDYYFSLAFSARGGSPPEDGHSVLGRKDKELSIEDKKGMVKVLLPVIAKLGDPVEQDLWLKKLASDLSIREASLREALAKVKLPGPLEKRHEVGPARRASQAQLAGERFLGLALKHPELGQKFLKGMILDMFVTPHLQNLAKAVKKCYFQDKEIKITRIRKDFSPSHYIDYLLFLVEEEFKGYASSALEQELEKLFRLLKKRYLSEKMEKATLNLKKAEEAAEDALVEKYAANIADLSAEMAKLK